MIKLSFSVVLLVINFLIVNVESKAQYVQPLTMGLQVAIPYDIANIWNRPVSLSPFVSTFLGLALLYILFFGVITSPFGYMFGVPSQKYVMGTEGTDSLFSILLTAAEEWNNASIANANSNMTEPSSPRSLQTSLVRKVIQYRWAQPDFSESVFKFIPSSFGQHSDCQLFILCHAHFTLRSSMPDLTVPVYRIFSKMLTSISEDQHRAIKQGLKGESCDAYFDNCPTDVYSLVARIFLESLPDWLRRSLTLPKF